MNSLPKPRDNPPSRGPSAPLRASRTSKLWLAFGGVLVVLLAAAVFTLGSLKVPFEPREPGEFTILFAVSTFIVAALFVFGLILTRSLLRLWAERSAGKLGSRFKSKMVFGAMGISLLPVIFMFFISYALMNRTLSKWFPRPLEIANQETQELLRELVRAEVYRLQRIAYATIPSDDQGFSLKTNEALLIRAIQLGGDAAWVLGPREEYIRGMRATAGESEALPRKGSATLRPPRHVRDLSGGGEIWESSGQYYLASRILDTDLNAPWITHRSEKAIADAKPLLGSVLVARTLPNDFLPRYDQVEAQVGSYEAQRQGLRSFKNQILLVLALFTVLLLFSATWFALFLSKQVTVPIQALAEGTHEVSRGNFGHQVEVQAHDELGILVTSFNQMTRQLDESRQQLNEFTRSLQQAVTEIEERRKLMSAILENIPTGVLSLDASGSITSANQAVARIFGEHARDARALPELLGADAARGIEQLMRKSLRMGTTSQELEIAVPGIVPLAGGTPALRGADPSAAGLSGVGSPVDSTGVRKPDRVNGAPAAGRLLRAAVTVSSLGPRRANPGYVVVIDDLTELLRAQKAAAWQSVAQRIAHEIKNPLTPIQLSVQQLLRHLGRSAPGGGSDLETLAGECAALIEREVATLASLVDEFSQFARFPTARPVPVELNSIVTGALGVFAGRMDGVTVRTELSADLPAVKADPELLRRVLVNLIDNAAEAMEGSPVKQLTLATRLAADGETIEIVVADSGHGISPEDKDKLFLPHFSTRSRGTGLGLAIAGRIVAEHHGTIRVEDNHPVGVRFVIRLPVMEAQPAQTQS